MSREELLTLELERLRDEHRDLDAAIVSLQSAAPATDVLALKRLKKRKLALRDRMRRIEDELTPDITA